MSHQHQPRTADDMAVAVSTEIQKTLVADFQKSYQDAATDAGGTLSPDQQQAIVTGWVMGVIAAAGEVATASDIPWLTVLSMAGCAAANGRALNNSEDQLHQMLHGLTDQFPDGRIEGLVVGAGSGAREAFENAEKNKGEDADFTDLVVPKITSPDSDKKN